MKFDFNEKVMLTCAMLMFAYMIAGMIYDRINMTCIASFYGFVVMEVLFIVGEIIINIHDHFIRKSRKSKEEP